MGTQHDEVQREGKRIISVLIAVVTQENSKVPFAGDLWQKTNSKTFTTEARRRKEQQQ